MSLRGRECLLTEGELLLMWRIGYEPAALLHHLLRRRLQEGLMRWGLRVGGLEPPVDAEGPLSSHHH